MRKIFQYILMAVALIAAASCSNELDEVLQPAGNGSLQFVVSDFPAFGESPDTRAIGTQDPGKTAWEKDDQIIITLTSQKYGKQIAALTYNGSAWSTKVSLSYLENETPEVTAVYAPCYKLVENELQLKEGMQPGMAEYIPANCSFSNNAISISFTGVIRNYSRLRIAADAGQKLTVTTTGFTPAGATEVATEKIYTLTTDEKGNAYLYGIFAEGATVSVKAGDATLKDYTFTADKNPNGTEHNKSYALDAILKYFFSVSAYKQVTFSKGNLQYNNSTNTWSFASAQYEMIGTDNVIGGSVSLDPTLGYKKEGTALADKIDLFGWSTNSTNFGVNTSADNNDYQGSFVDWGTNKIGVDTPGTWRTLTYDEWYYLRYTRVNANNLMGIAQVNGVNGLIILPDNWTCPDGVTFKSGFNGHAYDRDVDNYAEHQTFTADQWSQLESAGAVFLPAAGYRRGLTVGNVQGSSCYWSATTEPTDYPYSLLFQSFEALLNARGRYFGYPVRLVKDL